MKKTSPIYLLIDPAGGGLSASRLASLVMIFLDAVWMIFCILGYPPKEAYTPVSAMLGGVTGAAFTAYAANSYGRVRGMPPPVMPKGD
jgi:hypothetical protein